MAYVKLDCGILDSTLWIDREAREIFITALLMATPFELREPTNQIEVHTLNETGFVVPPGWYGFVEAAGPGISARAGLNVDVGREALKRLGEADIASRTPDFEGRRLVRVNGGYIVLNYDKYRRKDHTAAERCKRYRERKATRVSTITTRVSTRSDTQAEAEAEAEEKKKEESNIATSTLVASPSSSDLKLEAEEPKAQKPRFKPPTLEMVLLQAAKIGLSDVEAKLFFNHYESNGWKVGRNPMASWHASMNTWKLKQGTFAPAAGKALKPPSDGTYSDLVKRGDIAP